MATHHIRIVKSRTNAQNAITNREMKEKQTKEENQNIWANQSNSKNLVNSFNLLN